MSVISLKNITAAYGNKDVLMHFNLEIARGEFVMLIGTSGCGKTTALKLMNGLLRPKEGSVVVNGKRSVADRFDSPAQESGICGAGNRTVSPFDDREKYFLCGRFVT